MRFVPDEPVRWSGHVQGCQTIVLSVELREFTILMKNRGFHLYTL